jgi:hypothetical protein
MHHHYSSSEQGNPLRYLPATLDLRLAANAALPSSPTVTYARAGNMNHFNSSGVLTSLGANVAAFDFNPGTGLGCKGLLLEDATTNEMLHNRDWSNAVYSASNVTAVKNATGLDGVANSASTLTADADSGTITQAITLGSAKRTSSVWVRRKTGTGTIEFADDAATFADITAALNTSTYVRVFNVRTQANPSVGFRFGTSGDAIEVDMGMCEPQDIPTSPIATTTGSASRSASNLTMTDVSWLSETEGTLYLEFQLDELGATSRIAANFSDGNSSVNRFTFFAQTTDDVRAILIEESTTEVDITSTGSAIVKGTVVRAAFAYKINDFELVVDGTSVGTDNSSNVAFVTDVDTIEFGVRGSTTQELNGHLRRVWYIPARLTSGMMRRMTSPGGVL